MTQIEQYVIERTKKMREERGISQAELADLMNVSHSFIGQVESSKYRTKYNLNHINQLASILKCSFAEFFPEKPFPEKISK